MGECRDCRAWGQSPGMAAGTVAPGDMLGVCGLATVGPEHAPSGLAFAIGLLTLEDMCGDDSIQPVPYGFLWTRPDFGCNQFAPREGR